MAIASLDQYIAASKQRIRFQKASRTVVATIPYSVFDLAGTPGVGVLPGTSTTVGVVPTDATAGCPSILFSTGVGYLSKVEFGSSVASRLSIYDILFKAGNYAYNSGTTALGSQPVISQRCPDYPGSGTVFGVGMEIWVEVAVSFVTGTVWQIQVTYTNSSGTAGRTSVVSVAQAAAALVIGKMFQITLMAGDVGVQKIESVIVTTGGMTAGSANVLILRPLWTSGRCMTANDGDVHDLLRTGMPIVYTDSALELVVAADSTASGVPEVMIEIANG